MNWLTAHNRGVQRTGNPYGIPWIPYCLTAAFDVFGKAGCVANDLSNDKMKMAAVEAPSSFPKQKDKELEGAFAGKQEACMLAGKAEVSKTFVDAEDMAERFAI